MARKSSKTLDQKIEEAQQKVIKTKAAYDKAVDDLQVLIDKKRVLQTDALIKAIENSDKTIDEVIRYVNGESAEYE